MIVCDLCGEAKTCAQRQIEGKEYDICATCWEPFATKLTGKGRVAKVREPVTLPSPPPEDQPREPVPGAPPKIWATMHTA